MEEWLTAYQSWLKLLTTAVSCNTPKVNQFLNVEAAKTWNYFWQNIRFSVGVMIMELLDWLGSTLFGKNLENFVEDETLKQTQKMFESYGFKPINENTYIG